MFALDCSRCYTKTENGIRLLRKIERKCLENSLCPFAASPWLWILFKLSGGKSLKKLRKAGTLPLNRHTRMQNKDLLFFQPSTQNFVFSLQGPPSVRNKNNVNHYPLSSSTQCHVADVEAYGWMGISAADKKHSWSRNIIYNNGNNNCFSRIFIRYSSKQITKAIPKCHKVSTHRARPIQVQIYKAILFCKMDKSPNTV